MRISDWSSDVCSSDLLVLLHQVAQARHQRGQQWVRLGAEVAANQQRLLELVQVGTSGIGDGVKVALGEVDARPAHLLQPDIRHQQVGGEQAGPQPPPEMPAVAALGRPPRALPRVDVEHQEHAEDAEVRSEEHTSELQSLMRISYAAFCLKKKNTQKPTP